MSAYNPGCPAPRTGKYQAFDGHGRPKTDVRYVEAGEPLPPAPYGSKYRYLD